MLISTALPLSRTPAFFAVYTATIVHTLLYHRKEIANGFKIAYKSIRAGQKGNAAFKDYHNQAMSRYAEVPEWAYLILTIFAIILGCIALTVWPTNSSVSCSESPFLFPFASHI